MKLRLSAIHPITVVFVAALLSIALVSCGGDGGDSGPTPIPIATDPSGTPIEFETFRDGFADRLDAIGANIGSAALTIDECR